MEYMILSGFFIILSIISAIWIHKKETNIDYSFIFLVIYATGIFCFIVGYIDLVSEETTVDTVTAIEELPIVDDHVVYSGFTTLITELSEDDLQACRSDSNNKLSYIVRTETDKGLGPACLTIEVTK